MNVPSFPLCSVHGHRPRTRAEVNEFFTYRVNATRLFGYQCAIKCIQIYCRLFNSSCSSRQSCPPHAIRKSNPGDSIHQSSLPTPIYLDSIPTSCVLPPYATQERCSSSTRRSFPRAKRVAGCTRKGRTGKRLSLLLIGSNRLLAANHGPFDVLVHLI